MKSSTLRKLMLTAIVTAPLVSTPAFASGGGSFWNFWQQLVSLFQGSGGSSGQGGTGSTSLPGPGALGLVVIGLGAGLIVARRRQ